MNVYIIDKQSMTGVAFNIFKNRPTVHLLISNNVDGSRHCESITNYVNLKYHVKDVLRTKVDYNKVNNDLMKFLGLNGFTITSLRAIMVAQT